MMQSPKNTKCNMVYKDYKHGLYLLELFVLWLKISKCNCTYNQCANCISIYLSCTSMPIVSNNRLEKYLCYVVMIREISSRWLMTHKYRESIIVLSISRSVEPNEE